MNSWGLSWEPLGPLLGVSWGSVSVCVFSGPLALQVCKNITFPVIFALPLRAWGSCWPPFGLIRGVVGAAFANRLLSWRLVILVISLKAKLGILGHLGASLGTALVAQHRPKTGRAGGQGRDNGEGLDPPKMLGNQVC